MTRDSAGLVIELTAEIERAIQAIPYRTARKVIGLLEEIRAHAGAVFPGGYHGKCPMCDEHVGDLEIEACGDEYVCKGCIASWTRSADGATGEAAA